nr:tetraspanin-2A-like isoform X2 [Penaeus vannamei]
MNLKRLNMFSMENKLVGWLRHVLTVISVIIFIVGCVILGYMAWVLATSITVSRFLSGTLYLIALVLAIATEIGGLIALSILDTKLEMVLLNGWAEVNQGTRNIVQNKFNCCGFYGPKEFAYTNYPLSNSCYDGATETDADAFTNAQQLKQTGCGAPLKFWMDDNKAIWCSVLAGLGGLQLMCVILCIHIIHKLKDKSGYKRTSSKRRLHDEKSAYSL